MNILFLTLCNIDSIEETGIYQDLLRKFRDEGHNVFIISPTERRNKEKTQMKNSLRCRILKVRTLNIQKVNIFEKGMATLLIEGQFRSAVKKNLSDLKFDLVLYSTPPITFCSVISYIKQRDGSKSYLMLKDIFPQNAVDLEMFSKKGPLYAFFRIKEKKLYSLSDYIGCMSQANVDYIIKHNPEVKSSIVEICHNSIEVVDKSVDDEMRERIRQQYEIPLHKKVFVYGGNLGKPQGIDFLIKCINSQKNNVNAFFLIVGAGTEYKKIKSYIEKCKPVNVKLLSKLSKDDYDAMVAACDVGMIFLNHSFTIPNFPSRLLSYMQAKVPVLAVTDTNTDIGKVIVAGGFGWWSESNNVNSFAKTIDNICSLDTLEMATLKQRSYDYLNTHYTVQESYETIMNRIKE